MKLVCTGGRWSRAAVVLTALGFASAVSLVGIQSTAAATVTLPDMQVKVPTNQISVGTSPSTGHRQLQFTHITWDAGTGPFEIDPTYDSVTGTASFVQAIYNSPSPGTWQLDHTVPLPVTGVFNPPSDYKFPLTRFTLNQVNGDGWVGPVVATSPKTDYCITGDTKVGGVPNTPSATSPPQANCTSPTKPLGWSIGWGDEYDQTDSGQPIDLTGVPNGTYDLVGVVDPQHILTESDNTNNVTATKLQISNGSVTVLGQTNPTSTPPTVSITGPAAESNVSGTVSLSASATGSGTATISSVQWLLNGQPLGGPLTTAPYRYNWTVGSIPLGTDTLSAQATDSNGNIGTAAETVNVTSTTGGLTIDQSVKATGTGTATANLGAVPSGETLLALVASDGPVGGGQTATVSGDGLTWARVQRENSQLGDSEAWTATVRSPAPSVAVTSTLSQDYGQQLEVLALSGSGGVGASAVAAAASGAPGISLASKAAGSLSFAVGNDYDSSTARTLSAGQAMVAQTRASTGDDYWVQMTTSASTAAGQEIPLSDTAPTGDRWNFAAVEVVPGSGSPPDTTPPTVSITNPTVDQTVSGDISVAANATDNVAVASVQFLLDGNPLGNPVTKPPYAIPWDTTTVSNGTHTLSAIATDTSDNTAIAANVPVTVQNPAPGMTCFVMQASVSVHGHGTVTAPSFDTVAPGEVLLAFVGSDGPYGAGMQSATVSGGGLAWRLVNRANGQPGDAEAWTATAASPVSGVTVTSTPLKSGYDQDLTVVAYEGSSGVGASAASSAASGAPSVSLTTTAPSGAVSLVFAVGEDYVNATSHTPVAGQVVLHQWLDSTGDTYWSQYTNTPAVPGTKVTMVDASPTADTSNFVAVEMIGETSLRSVRKHPPAEAGVRSPASVFAVLAPDAQGRPGH